jgi:uncharacterized protein (TIGR03435 family)
MRLPPRHAFALVTPISLLACIALMAPSEAPSPFVAVHVSAQSPAPAEFEIVSIKRNMSGPIGSDMRTLPDGSQRIVNVPIRNFIVAASPAATREVFGLPAWAFTERYDVTVKPPAGSTIHQRDQMWRAMFADRMKLVAHVEQRERDVYSLVVARPDGTLGPNLKPSTVDCGSAGALPPSPNQRPAATKDAPDPCGVLMMPGKLVDSSMSLDGVASFLYGPVGGEVEDDTGLTGLYSVTLTFSPRETGVRNDGDNAPDIFTALQEQLGLKLLHRKRMMPVFVIDHIERPSKN